MNRQVADARVQPWQAELESGDYCRRLGPGFFIYHEILPNPEPRAEGLEHYRFTRGYSVACPRGELGDIHVSTVESRVTEKEFERARSLGWRV